ncbi:protein S-acyltransferase [Malassezia sp. CBS 17886]|nr:protein S-acyltransferase [Malassezia sp. CBS 17886]
MAMHAGGARIGVAEGTMSARHSHEAYAAHEQAEDSALLQPATPPSPSEAGAFVEMVTRGYSKKRAPLRTHEVFWIVGVIFIMIFLHMTSQLFIILPYYHVTPSFTAKQLLTVLGVHNALCAYMYYTYYWCVMEDAGGVPVAWTPDAAMERDGLEPHSVHRRFCHKCDAFKPPRSHHCRVCRRCVLRMDHHCPWIGNCVGHGTYAHFLRFTTAVVLAGAFHLAMISLRVADWWNLSWYYRAPSTTGMVFLILNYLMCMPAVLLTGFLALYHYHLVCTNTTSVETWEKDRVARQVRRGQIAYVRYPFDLGFRRNVAAVMGANVLWWPCPAPLPGDGLSFPVSVRHGASRAGAVVLTAAAAQYLWPPKDPHLRRVRRPPPSNPFTYGDERLNPALLGHEGGRSDASDVRGWDGAGLRRRSPPGEDTDAASAQPSPTRALDDAFYDSYESDDDDDGEGDGDDEYERSATVRMRRGSEGIEIIPPRYDRAFWLEFGGQQERGGECELPCDPVGMEDGAMGSPRVAEPPAYSAAEPGPPGMSSGHAVGVRDARGGAESIPMDEIRDGDARGVGKDAQKRAPAEVDGA